MFHNESVNVWTHLIAMIMFGYIIVHHHWRYEPSEFYYNSILNNANSSLKAFDYGVPYPKFLTENLLSNLTNDFYDKYFYQSSLSEDLNQSSNDSLYNSMVQQILGSNYFDEF